MVLKTTKTPSPEAVRFRGGTQRWLICFVLYGTGWHLWWMLIVCFQCLSQKSFVRICIYLASTTKSMDSRSKIPSICFSLGTRQRQSGHAKKAKTRHDKSRIISWTPHCFRCHRKVSGLYPMIELTRRTMLAVKNTQTSCFPRSTIRAQRTT